MSYNPYEPVPTTSQTAAWPTEAPATQVPGWGTDQPYGGQPPGMSPMGPPQAPGNKPTTGLIVVLILLAVAALGAGAFFVLGGDDDDETANEDPEVVNNDPGTGPVDGPVTTLPGNPEDIEVDDPPELPTGPGAPDVPIEDAAADAGPPEAPPTGDSQFDDLAQDCYQGDMQACDDLYLGTPVGSEYEAYGDTCGARISDSHGYYCTDLLPNPEPPAD
ncbi:MAG: hypothetical protein ACRD2C_04720 [Acidimicrobiales bacterium]